MTDSSQRPRKDNVIYANFGKKTYSRTPPAEPPSVGVDDELLRRVAKQLEDRAFAHLSPAAARLIRAAEERTDQGRVGRGRDYAKAGNVVDIEIRNGAAHAQVAGSQTRPFETSIILPYRSADELTEITRIITRSSGAMSKIYEGDVPEEVLDVLIAEDASDIRFSCTCPDPAVVCKHAIAFVDRLGARIDADPSVIFAMRGMDLDTLAQAVQQEAQAVSQEATAPGSDLFWAGRKLPDLPSPKLAPALDDSDMDLLHKALRHVSYTSLEELRGVADIEDLYDFLTR